MILLKILFREVRYSVPTFLFVVKHIVGTKNKWKKTQKVNNYKMIEGYIGVYWVGWPNGKASLSGYSCMAKIAGSSPVLIATCRS